jgi:hypothetical protein
MRDNAYTYSNGTIQILRMYDAGESLEDIMQATGKTKATIRTTILTSGREAADFVGFKNRYNASAQAWGIKWNHARAMVLRKLGGRR